MRTTLLALLAAAVLPLTAQAQTEALPDLTPREFEIQGDLQVDFSGIRRQPLAGFGPPPRAYVVPAERVPVEYAYGFPLEQIKPPTLAAQPIPKIELLSPLSGLAEGLAGVYGGRAARLRLQQNGATGAFYLDADYDGSSTYTPFDEAVSDGTVIYNRAIGTVGYATHAGLRAEAGGRWLNHELYGATFALPATPAGTALPGQPARTTSGVHALVALEGDARPLTGFLRYDFAAPTTDLDGLVAPGETPDDVTEGRLTAAAQTTWRQVRLDGRASVAGTDAAFGTDVQGYSAGAAFVLRNSDTSQLAVGARLLSADGPLGSTVAVGPLVRFELRPRRSTVRVFAHNDPRVVDQALASILTTNPFVEQAPMVMPDVQLLNARGGVQTQLGAVRATIYGGVQWGDRTQFFERDPDTGLFTVAYGETRRVFGGLEAALGAPDRIEATVGVEARSGRLLDAEVDVPYYAPLVAHVSVSAALFDDRVYLRAQARAEGTRPADRTGTEVPGFLDLGAEAAYRLSERLDVLLQSGGLAGEVERWAGYPEAPFTVLGGLRARW